MDASCVCLFILASPQSHTRSHTRMPDHKHRRMHSPLCAVTHSLADGRVTGAQASGVLQKVSASFFSKQIATGIKAYEATATEDGAVFAKLR